MKGVDDVLSDGVIVGVRLGLYDGSIEGVCIEDGSNDGVLVGFRLGLYE